MAEVYDLSAFRPDETDHERELDEAIEAYINNRTPLIPDSPTEPMEFVGGPADGEIRIVDSRADEVLIPGNWVLDKRKREPGHFIYERSEHGARRVMVYLGPTPKHVDDSAD